MKAASSASQEESVSSVIAPKIRVSMRISGDIIFCPGVRKAVTITEFRWEELISANNNDLLKNVGNLVNRVIKFCHTKLGGVVPHYTVLEEHQSNVNVLLTTYITHLEAMRLRLGLSTALQISALGNKFLQDNRLDNRLFAEEPETLRKCHWHSPKSFTSACKPSFLRICLKLLNLSLSSWELSLCQTFLTPGLQMHCQKVIHWANHDRYSRRFPRQS